MQNPYKTYSDELLKQTEPYTYWLYKENNERGESVTDCPLPCVFKDTYPGIETARVKHKEITYVIIKHKGIGLYPNAIESLLNINFEKLIPDLIYCDHDYQDDQGKRHTPYFKPDYSPHLLLSGNYMGELIAVREELFREELFQNDSVSERDAEHGILKQIQMIAEHSNKITHVSNILWYRHSNATSEALYEEENRAARNRIYKYEAGMDQRVYKLSVIIPSKDHFDILRNCIESLINKSGFNFCRSEIIVVDNGSKESVQNQIKSYIEDCHKSHSVTIHYLLEEEEFNFSAMCNRGAAASKGDYLLFLNDDVEITEEGCIDRLCAYASLADAGAVGLKLLYPGGEQIQHMGIANLNCGPTHKLATFPGEGWYYFGLGAVSNVLAVTGACLIVDRIKYFQVNGFHDKMKVSYNDVDLCVSLYEQGYYNLVLNHVSMIHHESLSRGMDLVSEEKMRRLAGERNLFCERHSWLNGTDPFYHRNLIQDSLDYRVNVPAEFEIRSRKSVAEVLTYKGCNSSPRILFTAERSSVEEYAEDGSIQSYVLEGWSLYFKHDERLYDRFLTLTDEESGEMIVCEMLPKLRRDVQDVFAKHKNGMLAGFVVRIDASLLQKQHYRLGVIYRNKLLKRQTMCIGDYDYEPGRGIHAGDAIL